MFSFRKLDNQLFFLFAQVTSTWLCRIGPLQLFFAFVTGTGPRGLKPFYSCLFPVSLENVFLCSQTLFVKKVVVKRCFWYAVAARACFYKPGKQFFTAAGTLRFFAYLDFVPALKKIGRLLMYAILKWLIT